MADKMKADEAERVAKIRARHAADPLSLKGIATPIEPIGTELEEDRKKEVVKAAERKAPEPPKSDPKPMGMKADGYDGNGPMKAPWHLVPWDAIEEMVKVLEFGARKYAPGNWQHVEGWKWRYWRAAVGHLMAWWRGEAKDPESGLHPLAHVLCCVCFLLSKDLQQGKKTG